MKLHGAFRVGAATHTGCVRHANEDDYLIVEPADSEVRVRRGRLVVVADGMGGVTGGCEASRTAVRALGSAFLDDAGPATDPVGRMRGGFERACLQVFEQSAESPSLRGMGTTMTALNLLGDRVVIGHVGDSRCYRLRRGELEQLSEDHAVRGAENRLTRCVGGGRDREKVDVSERDLALGDVFLLATDGLWDVVPEAGVRAVLRSLPPQEAAEALVRQAIDAGAPDNCTALVVRVDRGSGAAGEMAATEVEIPAEELRHAPALATAVPRLRPPRWPWVLLVLAALLGAAVVARNAYGFDIVDRIAGLLRDAR